MTAAGVLNDILRLAGAMTRATRSPPSRPAASATSARGSTSSVWRSTARATRFGPNGPTSPGFRSSIPATEIFPRDPARHTSALAARAVLDRAPASGSGGRGIALTVRKGLPLSGGQGGSAASAVAGAVAVNALLGHPLDRRALLDAASSPRRPSSGRHADNIAPSLLGGIVLIRCWTPWTSSACRSRPSCASSLVRPTSRCGRRRLARCSRRRSSRRRRSTRRPRSAAMVAALALGDYELLGRAIDDRIAEPARAGLLPGFAEAKAAALAAGALGSSISGSGPTAFALARGRDVGERVAAAMSAAYARPASGARSRVARIDRTGARVCRRRREGAR